jgi:hypothetical protein
MVGIAYMQAASSTEMHEGHPCTAPRHATKHHPPCKKFEPKKKAEFEHELFELELLME